MAFNDKAFFADLLAEAKFGDGGATKAKTSTYGYYGAETQVACLSQTNFHDVSEGWELFKKARMHPFPALARVAGPCSHSLKHSLALNHPASSCCVQPPAPQCRFTGCYNGDGGDPTDICGNFFLQ